MDKICYGLENKVILITGGSRGLGLAIVKALVEEKAKIAFCARKQEGLDAARRLLGGYEHILTVQAHIAREDDVENLFNAVMKEYGRLDVLINNVGMNLVTPSVVDTDFALWQKIIDTNLSGTFLCSKKAAAIMREQKQGKIINISSIAAKKASPGMGIYGAAKAGVEMLTKVLSAELAQHNIQVNTVAPSMIRTDFSRPFWSNPEAYESIIRNVPLGRIADPVEIVQPILFLASEASNFITGETLMADGGSSAV